MLHVELEFVFVADDDSKSVNARLFFVKFYAKGHQVYNAAVPIGMEFSFEEFLGTNVERAPLSVQMFQNLDRFGVVIRGVDMFQL